MAGLELSVKDQFIELGNKFFNVKSVEWSNSYDLGYESSSTDPVNKYFIEGEEKINEFLNSLIILFSEFLLSLKGKKQNKKKDFRTHANNDSKSIYYTSCNTKFSYRSYKGSEFENSVTQYNVSRNLINKLNEELKSSSFYAKKRGADSVKYVLKNRMKSDMEDNNNEVNRLFFSQIKNGILNLKSISHFK